MIVTFKQPTRALFQDQLTPDDDEYYYPDLKFGLDLLSDEEMARINNATTARDKAKEWLDISPKGLKLWDVDALEKFFHSMS